MLSGTFLVPELAAPKPEISEVGPEESGHTPGSVATDLSTKFTEILRPPMPIQ